MGLWHRFRARLGGLLHRDVIAGEIREELEFHLRMRAEEYERAGEPQDGGAPTRAGASAISRYCRTAATTSAAAASPRRFSRMPATRLRLLWHQRGFSLVAILTLALGIGMTTALVSVIDAAMLRAVPYSHPEQIVNVRIDTPQRSGERFELTPSVDDMRIMRDSNRAFSEVAVWRDITRPAHKRWFAARTPSRLRDQRGLPEALRNTPILGRGIQAEDTRVGAPAVDPPGL